MAIENMNGQFLGGKQVSVQYAFKKDGKAERHGTQAERLLAAQAKKRAMGFDLGGSFTSAAFVAQTSAPPATPASAVAPPALPAGFSASQVIGAPPPPPGAPAYGAQGYPAAQPAGYPQNYGGYSYDAYGANGYQQQGGAPPPPPPIRMGFNQ